jgi:hypothetical protein
MHTKQQIEQWARESGMIEFGEELPPFNLVGFAELVAQHERRLCQSACDAISSDLTNDVHVRLGAAKCHSAIRGAEKA